MESSEYDDLLEHYNDVLSRKQATAQTLKAIDDELRTIEARLWQIAEQRQAKQIVGSRYIASFNVSKRKEYVVPAQEIKRMTIKENR